MRKLHEFLDLVAYWWHRASTSRYVLHLEIENRRLKDEVSALRDTVFGLRGLPPVSRVSEQASAAPLAARDPENLNRPVKPVIRGQVSDVAKKEREAAIAIHRQQREQARQDLVRLQNELNEEIKRERDEPTVQEPIEEEGDANR